MLKQCSLLAAAVVLIACFLSGCTPVPEAAYESSADPDSAVSGIPADSAAPEETAEPSVPDPAASESPAVSAGDSVPALPVVYFTPDVSPAALMAVYECAEWNPTGKVAVKVSTGESGSSNYLRPELIGDLVQSLDGTIVECNTAYGGNRSTTEEHLKTAEEHGFTQVAPVVIQDAEGTMTIPVTGGSHLQEDIVGAAFDDFDSYVILSHFKGHSMAGFGGAIKNMAIGIASADGKALIHSGGTSTDSPWGGEQNAFLESMAEAAKAVADYQGDRIVYVNVMNRLSVDCDCDAHPAEPDMHDIGILASTDPVALDQACVDLIYAAEDGGSVVERIESRNGLQTLAHAEEMGLGSRQYTLVEI